MILQGRVGVRERERETDRQTERQRWKDFVLMREVAHLFLNAQLGKCPYSLSSQILIPPI
jgi:hypothetical protein